MNRHDPARLPGASFRTDRALDAAIRRPRTVALLVVILLAILAFPAIVVVALARATAR